jgi:hypothetical protein
VYGLVGLKIGGGIEGTLFSNCWPNPPTMWPLLNPPPPLPLCPARASVAAAALSVMAKRIIVLRAIDPLLGFLNGLHGCFPLVLAGVTRVPNTLSNCEMRSAAT